MKQQWTHPVWRGETCLVFCLSPTRFRITIAFQVRVPETMAIVPDVTSWAMSPRHSYNLISFFLWERAKSVRSERGERGEGARVRLRGEQFLGV